jgi:nanoRNase/pAp phosphatase (c-di-AMP/oligoRNAs hydrolase)
MGGSETANGKKSERKIERRRVFVVNLYFYWPDSARDLRFAVVRVLPRPEVILTHESDLDGLVSGLLLQRLARQLFSADVPLEAFHYNNWRLREAREKSAWVCDLSFEPRLDKPDWVVVDHHATEGQPKNALLIHDLTKSAGLLCYELCKEHGLGTPELDRLVHLNNVADLFLEDSADFVLANDYANLVKTYQFWNLHALVDGKLENILDHPLLEVMAVKRRIEDPMGLEWSKSNVQEISSTVGYVETVVGNTNLIVHQLLEKQTTKYPVLMTLFRKANNTVVVSLRSRNGEALKIAEKLQGGGHANACGATLPRSVKNIPDAIDYLRYLLETSPKKDTPLNNLEGLFAGLEIKNK